MAKNLKRSSLFFHLNILLFVVFAVFILAVGCFLWQQVSRNKTDLLFIQEAASGTFTPKDNGTYELTLQGVSDGTLYFSDRPKRVVGSSDTSSFVSTWGEGVDNFATDPPNAVLVINNGSIDQEDAIVVELANPLYNKDTSTLRYDVKVLEGSFIDGLSSANRRDDSDFPQTLTNPVLFIDGCCSFMGCSFTCAKNPK